jgi:hypothetical protein
LNVISTVAGNFPPVHFSRFRWHQSLFTLQSSWESSIGTILHMKDGYDFLPRTGLDVRLVLGQAGRAHPVMDGHCCLEGPTDGAQSAFR